MSNKQDLIRIYKEDKDKVLTICKEQFLDQNPEFKNVNITYPFMLHRIIKFYIEN